MKLDKIANSLSLDSGGVVYPYIATRSWTQGFRMEARLDEQVDYDTLLQAVERVRQRLPYHFVTVAKSFLQYRLRAFEKPADALETLTDQLCEMLSMPWSPLVNTSISLLLPAFAVLMAYSQPSMPTP